MADLIVAYFLLGPLSGLGGFGRDTGCFFSRWGRPGALVGLPCLGIFFHLLFVQDLQQFYAAGRTALSISLSLGFVNPVRNNRGSR
ncbi:MAG: hypothetical protein AB1721_02340 [Patescibacteria group bacterium]